MHSHSNSHSISPLDFPSTYSPLRPSDITNTSPIFFPDTYYLLHPSDTTSQTFTASHATSLAHPLPLNTHHMVTRAKYRVFKPRVLLSDLSIAESDTIPEALQTHEWKVY